MKVRVESLIEGLMVYWSEVENASRYYVHLLIVDSHRKEEFDPNQRRMVTKFGETTYQEIKLIECDRHTKVYSFTGLSYLHATLPSYQTNGCYDRGYDRGLNYYVYVEAEDKEGNIIEKSEKIKGRVYLPFGGYYLC